MTLSREEKVAVLSPLVERMCVSHYWRRGTNGPVHVRAPFTAAHLSEHVAGTHVYGLCPIKPGESTCRVGLLDLDSHKGATPWKEMRHIADVISLGLEDEGLVPHQWRSSGGHGIHIICTWPDSQDAYSVRTMFERVLASCGYENGTGGVSAGAVEVFPKQNSVAPDAFGNMFILGYANKSEPI